MVIWHSKYKNGKYKSITSFPEIKPGRGNSFEESDKDLASKVENFKKSAEMPDLLDLRDRERKENKMTANFKDN